jgi:SAM-dependent methyltransferase
MSLERLREHRSVWQSKPVLPSVYGVWFRLISGSARGGSVVEIGAGPGFLAEWAHASRPQGLWVATDLLPAPWNDLAADATNLPFRDGAATSVVGIDVLHHLGEPRRFFEEAARVLAPGGVIVLVEPWVTALSYPIYRWLHPEGCDLWLDPWRPFASGSTKEAFEGDAAVAWRILRSAPPALWRELGFEPPRLTVLNGFAYLMSLGFRRGSLLPTALLPLLLRLDSSLAPLARVVGMRVHAVWRRA